MKRQVLTSKRKLSIQTLGWAAVPLLLLTASPTLSQAEAEAESAEGEAVPVQAVVNSNQDTVTPDSGLTLREAILLTNGELAIADLSAAEQAQVESLSSGAASQIGFNLPADQTTIQLQEMLPSLAAPGLVLDGGTQPGYDAETSAIAEVDIPIPLVSITSASGQEVLRGLTIVADGVTVRGLSLYGFNSTIGRTATTPPADIFIAHAAPPPDTSNQQPPARSSAFINQRDEPPQDITIENNWLGIMADGDFPAQTSAFGVSVFNSQGATIRNNFIANHEGSGIITSVQAQNLEVINNAIVGNGIAGMPDGIRLEGDISNSLIQGNVICGSDGSGIYAFKPDGSVEIRENDIKYNGRRLRRSAVYLMGNNHQVLNNAITYQAGSGVTIAGYPSSIGNVIQGNQFLANEGLSIDLIMFDGTGVQDYAWGDGPNPQRNSVNRRGDTGNAAINAPELQIDGETTTSGTVALQGTAEPDADVVIYRVAPLFDPPTNRFPGYGDLLEPVASVKADADGLFSTTAELEPGDRVSAIATLPAYGTSEPSPYVAIGTAGTPVPAAPDIPQCVTAPPAPEPEPEPAPEPLVLNIPRNVHFALDRADLSAESQTVLDQIADVLLDYPFITIELQGHTDPRASYQYNLELSNRRALAARNYLLSKGVANERMTIRALSESQRATTGDNVVDYARDRRVEVIFRDLRGLDIVFERQENDLQIEGQ